MRPEGLARVSQDVAGWLAGTVFRTRTVVTTQSLDGFSLFIIEEKCESERCHFVRLECFPVFGFRDEVALVPASGRSSPVSAKLRRGCR